MQAQMVQAQSPQAGAVQARVIYVDRDRGVEEVAVGDHSIELSCFGGDGYCHNHRSHECAHQLTDDERDALAAAVVLAYAL